MEFVSSDTNVWIDFKAISRLNLPFLLPYTYIMNWDAIEDELCSPAWFKDEVLKAGLQGVDITMDEFILAEDYGLRFPKLSIHDRIALAIAKVRQITLLTGDLALRRAADKEGVHLLGTIGILDKLYEGNYIQASEYKYCLIELQKQNGGEIRLPKSEIASRIQKLELDT